MLSLNKKFLATAIAIGVMGAGGLSGAAMAQNNDATSMQPQTELQQQHIAVTDEQLENFAEAEATIRELHTDIQDSAKSVESQEEMQELQKEANAKTQDAIEKAGLSVTEYQQIASALQANPELQQKFMKLRK